MKEYKILYDMISRVEESQEDLFCSGLCSVPEYVLQELEELKEQAADYGMKNYEERINALLLQLKQTRHEIRKNGAQVMAAYGKLYVFNRQLKKRVQRDMICRL